jgi:hypothetical protein
LCDDCEFLQWGSFQTQSTFSTQGLQYVDRIDGWWVSGNLASAAEINALEASGGTATYAGHVIGTVLTRNEGFSTRTATGDLLMQWSFASRTGNLSINNFDGKSFNTPDGIAQRNTAINQFDGVLTGGGLSGSAAGSFVRGPNSPVQGVIGNWRVGGSGYSATGIFGGTQAPNTQ